METYSGPPPPPYEALPTAPPLENAAPHSPVSECFASNALPQTTNALHPQDLPPLLQASSARISVASDGTVTAHDDSLKSDPKALMTYFQTHLQAPPILKLRLHGYYVIKECERHHHGEERMVEKTITDFDFTIDLSSYISQSWHVLVSRDGGPIKEVLEEYCHSNDVLEVSVVKVLTGWNMDCLVERLRQLVLWTGYGQSYSTHHHHHIRHHFNHHHHRHVDYVRRPTVSITYTVERPKIIARPNTTFAKCLFNDCVACLSVVTCLWPIYCVPPM